jgi:hypothetical protein
MLEGVHDSPVLCTFWCSNCVLHIVGKTYISNIFSNPVMSGEVRSFESSFSLSSSALDGSTGNPPESWAFRTRKGSERTQFALYCRKTHTDGEAELPNYRSVCVAIKQRF